MADTWDAGERRSKRKVRTFYYEDVVDEEEDQNQLEPARKRKRATLSAQVDAQDWDDILMKQGAKESDDASEAKKTKTPSSQRRKSAKKSSAKANASEEKKDKSSAKASALEEKKESTKKSLAKASALEEKKESTKKSSAKASALEEKKESKKKKSSTAKKGGAKKRKDGAAAVRSEKKASTEKSGAKNKRKAPDASEKKTSTKKKSGARNKRKAPDGDDDDADAATQKTKKRARRSTAEEMIALTREQATELVKSFSLEVTGARPGEFVIGFRNVTDRALMRLTEESAIVCPRRKCIVGIFAFPDLRTAFLQDLARIPFFYDMTEEQRAQWLLDHATDSEGELADIGSDESIESESDAVDESIESKSDASSSSSMNGKSDKKTRAKQVMVELHDLGKSNLVTHVAPDVLSQLVANRKSWTARYIRNQFPKASNSKARHHTLFFLAGFWRVETASEVRSSISETDQIAVLHLEKGLVSRHAEAGPDESLYMLNKEFAVLAPRRPDSFASFTKEHVLELARRQLDGRGKPFDPTECKIARERCELLNSCLSPTYSKSHLQKNVRFDAENIVFPSYMRPGYRASTRRYLTAGADDADDDDGKSDDVINADCVSVTVAAFLMVHAGVFLPELGKFSSGLEMFCKRMGVIIPEDSFADEANLRKLFDVMACASLSQGARSWRPTDEQINMMFALLIYARTEWRSFDYDTKRGSKLPLCTLQVVAKTAETDGKQAKAEADVDQDKQEAAEQTDEKEGLVDEKAGLVDEKAGKASKTKKKKPAGKAQTKKKKTRSKKEKKAPSVGKLVEGDSLEAVWSALSSQLDMLGSFAGDKAMLRDLAHQSRTKQTTAQLARTKHTSTKLQQPKQVPLCHKIDQHCGPNFAYLFEPRVVEEKARKATNIARPFDPLFGDVFNLVTGWNVRHQNAQWSAEAFERDPWVRTVRRAQNRYLRCMVTETTERPLGMADVKMNLDEDVSAQNGKDIADAKMSLDEDVVLQNGKDEKEGNKDEDARMDENVAPQNCKDEKKADNNDDRTVSFDCELDRSLIAGAIGHIEVRVKHANILVILNPNQPEELVAIRRPARGMKDAELSDVEREKALELALEKLEAGIVWGASTLPVPEWKGARVRWDSEEEQYLIKLKRADVEVAWDTLRKLEVTLPWFELPAGVMEALPIDEALRWHSHGIAKGAKARLRQLLDEKQTPIEHVRSALALLVMYHGGPQLDLKDISRNGGGTADQVLVSEVGAFHLLLKISILYPSALRRAPFHATRFLVDNAPLLWQVRDRLNKVVARAVQSVAAKVGEAKKTTETKKSADVESKKIKKKKEIPARRMQWPQIDGDKAKRTLRPCQVDTVNRVVERTLQGKKGSVIDTPPGMGKTLAIKESLRKLASLGLLPKHVVWISPREAISSNIAEMSEFDEPPVWLVPTKSKPKQKDLLQHVQHEPNVDKLTLPEYRITLIEANNHLRLCTRALLKYAADTYFVFDEFHLMIPPRTQRTSSAHTLALMSKGFAAMSGTITLDSDTGKLIWWLQQANEFHVTAANFWVAACGRIAHQDDLDFDVDERFIKAEWPSKNLQVAHQQALLGAIVSGGGASVKARCGNLMAAANICHEAALPKVIDEIRSSIHIEGARGVAVFSKDAKHAECIRRELLAARPPIVQDASKVFVIGRDGNSIHLSDLSVSRGQRDYPVVIAPKSKCQGYSLARLSHTIRCVYFSNASTRRQLSRRIERLGQNATKLVHKTIHIGVLSRVLEHHKDATSVEKVLNTLAKKNALVDPA